MGYRKARADLEFVRSFKAAVERMWAAEEDFEKVKRDAFSVGGSYRMGSVTAELEDHPPYQEARAEMVRGISRAVRISRDLRLPVEITSYPAPAVGGPIVRQNVFELMQRDETHRGLDRQDFVDALNRLVGAAEDRCRLERRRRWNPLYWLTLVVGWILRIPFALISATGFNVAKIEDHLWGRLFKVLELLVLLWLAARFGQGLDISFGP